MNYFQRRVLWCLVVGLFVPTFAAVGQTTRPTSGPVIGYGRMMRIEAFVDRPDSWYLTSEGERVCDNIVGWQNPNGGWFKNYDARQPRPAVIKDDLNSGPPGDDDSVWHKVSTFDNNATHSELRCIARGYRVLKKPAYRECFERGLKYCLAAQYPNGGWPQRFPLQDNYGRYITINDDAMTGVMIVLKGVADGDPDYAFVDADERAPCKAAFERGVDCLLKCQYRQNGVLTVWCQQHDEKTLEPRGARTFELASLTGEESADVVELLMSIDKPDERVRQSIEAAVAWYEKSKITGKRWKTVSAPDMPRGRDRVVVDDPTAPPLWARFYDLQTNQPIFVSRDGVPRSSVDQISYERRMGYNWYGPWGTGLEQAYKQWKAQVGAEGATGQ